MYQTDDIDKMVNRNTDLMKRIIENDKIITKVIGPFVRREVILEINKDIFDDLDELSNLITDHDEEVEKLIKRIKMMVRLKDIL